VTGKPTSAAWRSNGWSQENRDSAEDAQEKAIKWVKNNIHDLYAWHDEAKQSIEAFCSKFGVTLQNYQINLGECIDYATDANNGNFRGVRLRHINREEMLTGYCLDCDLMHAFYDKFKSTGDGNLQPRPVDVRI
jgi:hypothetical protein